MHEDNVTTNQIDELVREMEASGIEANYIYIDRNNNVFNDSIYWSNYAKENGLFSTVGSDFHNEDEIHPTIGFANTTFTISKEETNDILNKLKGFN